MTRSEIKPLTGLRGVAATLVMLDHYAAVDFSSPFPLDVLPHLYMAVDMFMVLSGFVLAMTYEDRFHPASLGAAYRSFLLRRVARLYPVYALATVLCFGLCTAGWLTFLNPDTSLPALAANMVAIQTWTWPGSSLDGPGWSISTEWLANLAFPLLVPLVLRGSLARATCVGGLAFAGLVFSAVSFGQLFDVPSSGAVNVISGPGALGRCVSEFMIGMYCWRLRSRVQWTGVLAGSRVQLILLLILSGSMRFTVADTASVAVCALMLTGLSFDASVFAAVLRSGPLLYLGRISYSLYLLHIPLMPLRDGLARLFDSHDVRGGWLCAVLCSATVAVLLATLSRRYVERPAQRIILTLGSRRTEHAR